VPNKGAFERIARITRDFMPSLVVLEETAPEDPR
jgi:hypothetical protein